MYLIPNKCKLGKIVNNIIRSSNYFFKALKDEREPRSVEWKLHLENLSEFIDEVEKVKNGFSKASFKVDGTLVLLVISTALTQLPSGYKKKFQDNNCCSIFYDFEELSMFFREHHLPNELDNGLFLESISLGKSFLNSLVSNVRRKKIYLKPLKEINHLVLKFDRSSKHFQYFSYHKDMKYLKKTAQLIIEASEKTDFTTKDGRFQLLSIIAKIGENLSYRNISPRVTKYLSSDINIEAITEIRNFIFHREQDLDNHLLKIITEKDNKFFIDILKELLKIKRVLIETLYVLDNTRETIESISNFYNQDFSKIPLYLQNLASDHELLAEFCPQLTKFTKVEDTPEDLKSALVEIKAKLSNRQTTREFFNDFIENIKRKIRDFFKIPGKGKLLKDTQNIKTGEIIKELDSFKKPSSISIITIQQIKASAKTNNIKECFTKEGQEKINDQLRFYANELKQIISILKADQVSITGLQLYENLSFQMHYLEYKYFAQNIGGEIMVTSTLPKFCFTSKMMGLSFIALKNAPQRYQSDDKMKLILIPLTDEEYNEVTQEPIDKYALEIKQPVTKNSKFEIRMDRLLEKIGVEVLEKRLENHVAFLEIAKSFEYDQLLFYSIELFIAIVETLNRQNNNQKLSKYSLNDAKLMRNTICHNGLGFNIYTTHFDRTLKYLISLTKVLEQEIIIDDKVLSNIASPSNADLIKTVNSLSEEINIALGKIEMPEEYELINEEIIAKYGLKIVNVEPDGNCFFHAVERQLELLNNEKIINYQQLRVFAVKYIKDHIEDYQGFIDNDETIEQYLDRVMMSGQWADQNLIHALSKDLNINIVIIGNNHIDAPIVLGDLNFKRTIYLGHFAELHYFSLELIEGEAASINFNLLGELLESKLTLQDLEALVHEAGDDQLTSKNLSNQFEEMSTQSFSSLEESENKLKSGLQSVDNQNLLNIIAKINEVIYKEELLEISNWQKFLFKALSKDDASNYARSIIGSMGEIISNLEDWLDFGNLYEDTNINNLITILINQFQFMFDFAISQSFPIIFPPRYPDFNPGDDNCYGNSLSSGDDESNYLAYDNDQAFVLNIDIIGQTGNNTSTEFS